MQTPEQLCLKVENGLVVSAFDGLELGEEFADIAVCLVSGFIIVGKLRGVESGRVDAREDLFGFLGKSGIRENFGDAHVQLVQLQAVGDVVLPGVEVVERRIDIDAYIRFADGYECRSDRIVVGCSLQGRDNLATLTDEFVASD